MVLVSLANEVCCGAKCTIQTLHTDSGRFNLWLGCETEHHHHLKGEQGAQRAQRPWHAVLVRAMQGGLQTFVPVDGLASSSAASTALHKHA
jgi:hypothetical protein